MLQLHHVEDQEWTEVDCQQALDFLVLWGVPWQVSQVQVMHPSLIQGQGCTQVALAVTIPMTYNITLSNNFNY